MAENETPQGVDLVELVKAQQKSIEGMIAEQRAITERLIDYEKLNRQYREAYLKEMKKGDEEEAQLITKLSETCESLFEEAREARNITTKKIADAADILTKLTEKNGEFQQTLIDHLTTCIAAVKQTPVKSWKERVKEYGMNIAISLGAILLLWGAYALVSFMFHK